MFISKSLTNKKFSKVCIDFIKSFRENLNFDEGEFKKGENLSKTSYNINFEDGKLKENYGINELVLPEDIDYSDEYEKTLSYPGTITFKKAWRYKYYSQNNSRYEYVLIVYASDKKIYYNNIFMIGNLLSSLGSFTFNEAPTLLSFRLNGADCVGFATSTNNLVVWNCDSSPYAVATAPKFRSICFHDGKMFAIENKANYVVRYSSTIDPTSWTSSDDANSGRIDLDDFRGELRKVVSHFDNLYVFRDFGISKITSYSNNKFLASNLYNSSYKIYPSSICACNSDICFLQEDGLYKFDGYKVKKIDLSIFKNFKKYLQNNSQICFYNNKLFIACYLNFTSSVPTAINNNSVIVVDLQTEKFSIMYGVNVCGMLCLKDLNMSKLVFCVEDQTKGLKLWQLCKGNDTQITFDKFWQSNKFVVTNEEETKTLKHISILAKKSFDLTITSDIGTKTISVSNSSYLQKIKINLRGKHFVVSMSSTGKQFDVSIFKCFFVVEK